MPTPAPAPSAPSLAHRLARMSGRNPDEAHRAATPLELLFDLTFVVAFSQASAQLAHLIADGHVWAGVSAFGFAMGAVCWAWINFSWFASAFDTDDWFYRLTTFVQMIGVVVLALGLPALFQSIEEGGQIDNRLIVAGYVVMRVAMVAQWLRVARQDPEHRCTALTYAVLVSAAQVGWVGILFLGLGPGAASVVAVLLFAFEMGVPVWAELRTGGTPWNAHHLAERFGLLAIIALGEVIFGTVASVAALVEEQGWSVDAILVVVAGVGLAFGLWWTYFILPSGAILSKFRRRIFVWGYGHVIVYAAIAATGAGLHVVAYFVEGRAHIGALGAITAVAVPVLIFSLALFAIYIYLAGRWDPFHLVLFLGTVALLLVAILLAAWGVSLGVCLVIVTLSPVVVIVGFETLGHRHQTDVLKRVLGQ